VHRKVSYQEPEYPTPAQEVSPCLNLPTNPTRDRPDRTQVAVLANYDKLTASRPAYKCSVSNL